MISEAEYNLLKTISGAERWCSFSTIPDSQCMLNRMYQGGLVRMYSGATVRAYKIASAGKQAIIDYETARKEGIEAVYKEMYK